MRERKRAEDKVHFFAYIPLLKEKNKSIAHASSSPRGISRMRTRRELLLNVREAG